MINNANHQPIPSTQRIAIIDVLRGWAVLGVVLMNYFDFFAFDRNWQAFKPDAFTSGLLATLTTLFGSKSWTLLSLLFGYGFAVLMDKIGEGQQSKYVFFARRMFWLFVIAVLNSAFFLGDILKDYAVMGLVMLLFCRIPVKTTFRISLLLLIVLPFISAAVNSLNANGWILMPKLFPLYQSNNLLDVLWFGLKGTYIAQVVSKPYLYTVHVLMLICMLWGSILQKIKFFDNLKSKFEQIKETFWIALIASIAINLIDNYAKQQKWIMLQYFDFRYLKAISIMLLISSTICWLYTAEKCKNLFKHFAFIGKMALTNYIMQNIIGLIVFSGVGFGVWNTKPFWFYVLLAILVYVTQVFFSKWWLSKYNYGPIEWIWRQLSYKKRLSIRKNQP